MLYVFFQLDSVTPELYNRWITEASIQRVEKINKYVHYKDKLLSLCAYRLLCFALGQAAEPLKYNEYGKPYILDNPINFSISHCHGCVAAGVSDYEIGVDAELIKPYPQSVLKRVFTRQEKEQIKASSQHDLTFFKLWTLKESYVKAIGRGLSFPIQNVEFTLKDDDVLCNIHDFSFESYNINSHIISVCQKGRSKLSIVNIDDLDRLSV